MMDAQDTQVAVHVQNVSVQFGKSTVLHDVSVDFRKGQIHGIIGRNGSGKSVLFKCICGFLKPSEGSISVFGTKIGKDADFAPSTGMLIEAPGFLLNESGFRNLQWFARLSGHASKDRIREVLNLVGLDPNLRKKVSTYSLGMRQRLGIAQALLDDPKLLILDEPMNGLDNSGVRAMRELLRQKNAAGTTIIMASHNPYDIQELCDTVHEMDAGVLSEVAVAAAL